MTVANLVATPQVKQILSVADRLNTAERLFVARWLLDSLLTKEVDDTEDWQQLGLSSFEKEWDNEEDAIYDNWRTHYDVPAR